VPVGSHATVYLPSKDASKITESGKPLQKASGVKTVGMENDNHFVVNVSQGSYHFVIKG